jgi:uncharacterized protein
MKLISVKNLLRAEIGTTEKFDMDEDISGLDLPEEFEGHILSVHGKTMRLEDSVVVSGEGNVSLGLICDRCLDNFDTNIPFKFEREYILDRKEKSEIILAVPTQNICSKDCKGICLGCGVDLNNEPCKCNNKKTEIEE